jgi:hypothetical protein
MPVHQATANGNEERRAHGRKLRFSNFGCDEGVSYGRSIGNIIPHVNQGEICVGLSVESGMALTRQPFWTEIAQKLGQIYFL